MPWSQPPNKSSGQTVTAANWNELAGDFRILAEASYTEITANASVTATTEAGANTVVTMPSALSFEGVPHLFEFYSSRIAAGASALRIGLFEDGTSLGLLLSMDASSLAFGVHA